MPRKSEVVMHSDNTNLEGSTIIGEGELTEGKLASSWADMEHHVTANDTMVLALPLHPLVDYTW